MVHDLRDLTFIDVRGVHVLLDARSACRARQRLLLVPGPERVQRVLAVCCIDGHFELLDPSNHRLRLVA